MQRLQSAAYANAFEPGCSIGELTTLLAPRCKQLLAVDFAPSAVEIARIRCRSFAQVEVDCVDVHTGLERGPYDLIVFSELGYYFPRERLRELAGRMRGTLMAGGELVAVHWRGRSPDHVLSGDEVHALLEQGLRMRHCDGLIQPRFRLDIWKAT